jgi:hypothetical protein
LYRDSKFPWSVLRAFGQPNSIARAAKDFFCVQILKAP